MVSVNIWLLIKIQQGGGCVCNVAGYNNIKLEAAIKGSGKNREQIANYLGISLTSLSYKINGKREFKGSEIFKICEFCNICDEDRKTIFFNTRVD